MNEETELDRQCRENIISWMVNKYLEEEASQISDGLNKQLEETRGGE